MTEVVKVVAKVGEREPQTWDGRFAFTLNKLVEKGEAGATPHDFPTGCRVAHYVFRLRRDGIGIQTIREPHAGNFSGSHARYRLISPVTILSREVKT
jgi:hypothetical protein